MKLLLAYTALASVATIVSAASCTSDNALAWPYTPDDGTTCNGDEHCEAIVAEGQCNSLSLIDDSDTTCVEKLKMLKRAVNLDCTSNEQCFFFVDNSLLCLDQATGEYHDDVGGSGNAISGVYTGPDGTVQTVTGVTAESTPAATATRSRDSETTATESNASETTTGTAAAAAAAAAASSSSSSASSQSSSSASSQSSAASQSSATSQSASAAAQTGAAAPQINGRVGLLAVAAMPLVWAVV